MVYTCTCCKYIEYRQLIGCGNYYCTLHKDYMYGGSRQCQHFELKYDLKNDPFYNNEYNEVSDMTNDDVRKRLDEIVKNLMKYIIPKQINGRDLYGGYAVDMYAEYYVNVQFGIGFTPISENSDITHYLGFAQGMPICGEDIDDICNDFKERIRDEIVKRLALLCESVNKDTANEVSDNVEH